MPRPQKEERPDFETRAISFVVEQIRINGTRSRWRISRKASRSQNFWFALQRAFCLPELLTP
jgi:hypothetical protein